MVSVATIATAHAVRRDSTRHDTAQPGPDHHQRLIEPLT
jgi:hypothetical protein